MMKASVTTLRAAARVTAAVLASIGSFAFAGLIGLFGGGWPGLAAAAVIGFGVFCGTLLLLRRGTTAAIDTKGRGIAGKATETTGTPAKGPIPPATKAAVATSRNRDAGIQGDNQTQAEHEIRTSGSVCDPGPHEVEGADVRWIALDVRKGERVRGRLSERSGDGFDWYIVDERNLILLRNGGNFQAAESGDHVIADSVRWSVARDGPWFLVLDLYGRSNERLIEVDLRRS